MDAFTRALAHTTDLMKSMTAGAHVAAGGLLLVIVIALGTLMQHQGSGGSTYLIGGEPFPAAQIPAMEVAFGKAGLNDHSWDGNRLRVPKAQQAAYMAALADDGALPPDLDRYLERTLKSTGLLVSKPVQIELLKAAKQTLLQTWITKMRGVESALVLINLPERHGLRETETTASVSVRPTGTQTMDEARVTMLRYFVASAIGAKPHNVTVSDVSNGRVYAGQDAVGGTTAFADQYIARKREYEREWTRKITDALAYIQGALVTVNVELDPEIQHEESVTEYENRSQPPSTARSTGQERGATEPAELTAPGGMNQPAIISAILGGGRGADQSNAQAANVPSRTKKTALQGLTPRRVTASVVIPSGYYEKIWFQRTAAAGQRGARPHPAVLEQIKLAVKAEVERTVVNLLPRQDPLDRATLVTVSTFQQIDGTPTVAPGFEEQAVAWLSQNFSSLCLGALALTGLFMLRSVVRSAASFSRPRAESAAPSPGDRYDVPGSHGASGPRHVAAKRPSVDAPALQEELSELVRDDPDSAVAVLRNWIGSAS